MSVRYYYAAVQGLNMIDETLCYKWPKVIQQKFTLNLKYSAIRRWVLLPEQIGHCTKGSPRYKDINRQIGF